MGSMRARLSGGGLDFVLSVAVAIAALLVALIFVVAAGVSFTDGANAFVDGAFGSQLNIAGTLAKMVPLTLVALGWIVVYKAGRFHVGFPGQILVGGMFVTIVAIKIHVPAGLHLPLVALAGMAGGAAYAWIAAWLWARRGVNEILSTLLLNLIAAQLLAWWVRHPLHDHTTPLPLTPALPNSAQYPYLINNTDLHWDIVLVPIAAVIIAFLLARTLAGFRMRLVGSGERVARQAGVAPEKVGVRAIMLSGALAGLAGASLVAAGTTPQVGEDFGGTYGFTGIAVALLARNNALAAVPAALLFAALEQGGQTMEGTIGISSSLVDFIQGLMIVLVLAATTLLYLARRRANSRRTPRAPKAATPQPELEPSK
ncbi:MAG TPA: ABC transporter permease [Solirubrobacteraceae bacterium]|jgi:simple sugar transport system permease protein|nr:ABC transporter permease [Solirubrobacteraceae bacterium]